MDMLHVGHPVISRMKGLARNFVWWPGMEWENVKNASTPGTFRQKFPYTLGNGPSAPGHGYMLTAQVFLWEKCFY